MPNVSTPESLAIGLDEWITRQTAISAQNLGSAISATSLCRERPEFGQRIVPARGSVLASRIIANWDPEPDYFFHWIRDSATVMRACVDLMAIASDAGERQHRDEQFHDMVNFNLSLLQPAASRLPPEDYRRKTRPDCRQFLRRRSELNRLAGDKLMAEPRFNPDGTVDMLRWSRPQLDGPPLRALACLAYLKQGGNRTPNLIELLNRDLDFTLRTAGHRSIGPWEEPQEFSHHYFVALVQLGALVHGCEFAGDHGEEWRRAEMRLKRTLNLHWREPQQVFAAIHHMRKKDMPAPNQEARADQLIDTAILLAINEAALPGNAHSVLDPRAVSTLDALAAAFTAVFPINQKRPPFTGPAFGRSLADRYFGGNPWYVTTLGAAAFCYQRALVDPSSAYQWRSRGDEWIRTVRWITPADGSMSEQVDRDTTVPRSARHLTWSYAAFISTIRLRRRTCSDRG